jgi:hypothetical protein
MRALAADSNIPRTKERRSTAGDTFIGVVVHSTTGQKLFATIETLKE